VFGCDTDDVWLDTITTVSSSGAILSPLTGAQAVLIPGVNMGILFGGLNLSSYSSTNDMFTIDMNVRRNSARIELHYAEKPTGNLMAKALTQTGVPMSARFGHTMIAINDDTAVCFGGVTLHRRETVAVYARSTFSHKCNDGGIYILDVERRAVNWRKCTSTGPELLRSFQSGVKVNHSTILACGGIVTEGHSRHRAPLGTVHLLIFSEDYNTCTLQPVSISNTVGCHHPPCVCSPTMTML
jgi:hypothetical protein